MYSFIYSFIWLINLDTLNMTFETLYSKLVTIIVLKKYWYPRFHYYYHLYFLKLNHLFKEVLIPHFSKTFFITKILSLLRETTTNQNVSWKIGSYFGLIFNNSDIVHSKNYFHFSFIENRYYEVVNLDLKYFK